jgi:hypothetical protein
VTLSEEFVAKLCRATFLSLWSIANPRGKESGKELCDVLIVCDPDVIIVSVKEVAYKATPDVKTGMDRWTSKAVSASIKQIFGAERLLTKLSQVIAKDGAGWLYLPPMDRRRVHRLAVALGSKGEVVIADGDFKQGFVHVLDERAVTTLLTELDTITDFVTYLQRTEAFLETTQVIVPGTESLLALYLEKGGSYPDNADLLVIPDDLWDRLIAREEFKRKKREDKESYLWDALIEEVAGEHDPEMTESHGQQDDPNPPVERVTRIMAREDRFSRRVLAKAFKEFHQGRKTRSRVLQSPSGVVYVFLATPKTYDRSLRQKELLGRLFVARGMYKKARVVVGIATEVYEPNAGFSLDTAAFIKEEWTAEDQAKMEQIQAETGAFVTPVWTSSHEDEYPKS